MALLLVWVGRLAGSLGALVTGLAVLARATGSFHLGSFEAMTLLQAGVAAMVLGCLAYLAAMVEPGGR